MIVVGHSLHQDFLCVFEFLYFFVTQSGREEHEERSSIMNAQQLLSVIYHLLSKVHVSIYSCSSQGLHDPVIRAAVCRDA
jgi:hypothetical protein